MTKHGFVQWVAAATFVAGVGVLQGACLSRPAASNNPTVKTNFTTDVAASAVEAVDLLFVIDNSQSMGDKQKVLAKAVPELVKRLVLPLCSDGKNATPSADGKTKPSCADGKDPEFPPVADLHIGVISTSLGTPGQDTCKVGTAKLDDGARLLNRTPTAAASPSNFLAWLPEWPENNDNPLPPQGLSRQADPAAMGGAFAEMVTSVGEDGCGFEAQLESMYRFLIQPDPYATIQVPANPQVTYDGVDDTIIKQRAEFLRPNSLVAVIMLTDENESTYDPRAFSGSASVVAIDQRLWQPTDACADSPNSKDCTSKYFTNGGDKAPRLTDDQDKFNVRFFQMKKRFGFDPQFPVSRYVNGLSKPKIPNRDTEHPKGGEYDSGAANCTNPLFAAALPRSSGEELCKLPAGSRSPKSVFLAVIGGVPYQLLKDKDGYKEKLTLDDWQAIMGKDPTNYDFAGADTHMLESITPRAGLPGVGESDTADPLHGREHETNGEDLQYACTFALPASQQRDCSGAVTGYCDCKVGSKAPLCNGTKQVRGKAYPTIREFTVVRDLASQGIAASLCPETLEGSETADNYGYNPAVRTIINRLKEQLTTQCLPRALTVTTLIDKNNKPIEGVRCLILETMKAGTVSSCDEAQGLNTPDKDVLTKFKEHLKPDVPDINSRTICELKQLPANQDCQATGDDFGWCYLETSKSGCSAILFSKRATPASDTRVDLQCIDEKQGAGGTVSQ